MTNQQNNYHTSQQRQIRVANSSRYENQDHIDTYLREPYHALRLFLSTQLLQSELKEVFPSLPPSELKVLELASATGQAAIQLMQAGYDVTASDGEDSLLAIAREAGLKCTQFDVTQTFPFPTGSMHALLMGELIEHIFDTHHLLAECYRVLCDTGVLVITTPNLATLQDRCRFLLGYSPRQVNPLHEYLKLHIRPFTFSSLKQTLEQTGFVVTHFRSNYVSWRLKGKRIMTLRLPARLFPALGGSLIVSARKSSEKAYE